MTPTPRLYLPLHAALELWWATAPLRALDLPLTGGRGAWWLR